MTDNHILAPKVDLIMAMDDLRLRGCNHSADLLKKALFTVPESVVPVNWLAVEARISEFVNEYEMVGEDEQGRDGHYTPNESERALILDAMHGVLADDELMALLRPAAPVAAQPDVTQQTLDDVMAGIPARDAEIEALRKEIEALQAAPVKPYSLDLDPAGIRALTADAISGALALGFQGVSPPPNNEHWLAPFWEIGREGAVQAQQPVSGADGLSFPLTEIERKAISALIAVAGKAYYVAEDSEDDGSDSNRVNKESMLALNEALDALEALPDDQPGFVMGPSSKAEWALRRLIAGDANTASKALDRDQPSGNPGELDEREEFEAVHSSVNLRRNTTPGIAKDYADAFTERLWKTWQARAALAQQQAIGPGAAPRNSEILDLAISEGMTTKDGMYCGSAATILCFAGALIRGAALDKQDADKADAERYRYLRGYRGHKATGVLLKGILFNGHESLARTDEAIDAARKEQV